MDRGILICRSCLCVDWSSELGFFFQTVEQGPRINTGANHTKISATISPQQESAFGQPIHNRSRPEIQNPTKPILRNPIVRHDTTVHLLPISCTWCV
jgi:hypothetical protein